MTAWHPQPPIATPLAPPATGAPMAYSAPPPCFFDPAHGYAAEMVVWQPPRGVPRPIPVCPDCRQVLTAEAGEPTSPQHAMRRERGDDDSDVAEVALGAAGGLAGGMVLGSLLGDDEPGATEDDDDDWS
jgi:hypothetical protein